MPRIFGKLTMNNKVTVGLNDTISTDDATKDFDKILNNIFDLNQFLNFCHQEVLSCTYNYCKFKIDEVIRLTKTPREQMKDFITKKLMYTIEHFGKKLDEYLTENNRSAGPEVMKEIYNSMVKLVTRRYNAARINMRYANFIKIYNDTIDFNMDRDKLYDAIGKLNLRPIKGSYNKSDFEQKSFQEAVKIVSESYPEVTMTISQKVINGLIKSKDQYIKFINNPPITKHFRFTSIDHFRNIMDEFFRFYGRTSFDFYLFDVEPDFLIENGSYGNETFKILAIYKTIYGRNKGTEKLKQDIDKGYITSTYDKFFNTHFYSFNKKTPKNIRNFNQLQTFSTGEGVGIGMFYVKFNQYIRNNLPKKESFYAKFIKINTITGSMMQVLNQEFTYTKYDPNYTRSLSPPDAVGYNTIQAASGKILYAYMTATHIGTTYAMSNSVNLHGFSSYNNEVALIQLIPLTMFKNNQNVSKYFSEKEFNNMVTFKHEGDKMLGYFLKKLPENNYNFNTFDNYFCPITALNNQGGCISITDEEIIGIYFATGVFRRNDIRINRRELPSFYSAIFNMLKINIKINIYTCSKDNKLSGRLYYFVGQDGYYAYNCKSGEALKKYESAKIAKYENDKSYSVALVKGHVFNCNVRGSIKFLEDVNSNYDKLEDAPEIHTMMNQDIERFNKLENEKIENNKGYLLRHLKYQNKSVEKDESSIKLKYTDEADSHYFVYDYETRNSSNKYSIIHDQSRHVDPGNQALDEGRIAHMSDVIPYSNMSIKFDINDGNILDQLFTFDPAPQSNTKDFINWLVESAIKNIRTGKQNFNFYIFANNGSAFDNIILMYDVLRHIDFTTLNPNIAKMVSPSKCDVAGRPLSFDFTLILSREYNYKRIRMSFRDSYRILSTPVKSFGSTFGLDVVKLDYPYAFYQNLFGTVNKQFGDYTSNPMCRVKNVLEFSKLVQTNAEVKQDFYSYGFTGTAEEQFSAYRVVKGVDKMKNQFITWSSIGIDFKSGQLKSNNELFTDEFIKTTYNIRTRQYSKITTNEHMIARLEEYNDYLDQGTDIMFDYIEYCNVYNTYDCYNLVQAMVAFKNKIMEMSEIKQQVKLFIDGKNRVIDVDLAKVKEINIFQQRSISGIAWLIAVKSGCLDGVVKLSGQIQEFISCDKRGGKCFVNRKRDSFKSKHYDSLMELVGQDICDDKLEAALSMLLEDSLVVNDFCSMYPAALCLMGVPKGVPKPIYRSFELPILMKFNQPFWVCTNWKSKHLCDVPESCKKVDGKNMWTNGTFTNQVIDDAKMRYMIETTGEMTFDDFSYTQGEYPIGLYFEDCNYTIAGLMKVLYDERTRVRFANPGLGNAIKLVLNSIFGRSILKEKESRTMFVDNVGDHITKNRYKMTSSFTQYGNYSEVSEYTKPTDHKVYPQLGARCLSISKTMLGVQLYAVSNAEEKLKLINQGFVPPQDPKEICKWTVELAKTVDDQPIIECSSSYNDTDSEYIPTQSLRLIKSYLGKNLGQLHSDFEFTKTGLKLNYIPSDFMTPEMHVLFDDHLLLPLSKFMTPKMYEKFGDLPKEMALSAIEAYYCAPKSYGCRVFGIDRNGKFAFKDSVKFKGVFKELTSMDKIKELYNGNPVRFIDVNGVHFIHSKGNGLAAQQDVMCKEVMPFKLNKSKFYYAEGETIFNGHYRFDEMPIFKNNFHVKDDKIKYYLYEPSSDKLEYVGACFTALRDSLVIPEGYEYRFGEMIKCRLYKIGEPDELNIRHEYYRPMVHDKKVTSLKNKY